MSTRLLVFLILTCSPSLAGGQQLERHPYLQNLQPDSVEILWRTDAPAESWVEVREQNGGSPRSYHSNVPATAHQLRVPALKPDTRYLYRVGYGSEEFLVDEPIGFQTFPAEEIESYAFVAYGDHRNYAADHRAVVEAILARCRQHGLPRFVLDTGDFTGQGEHQTDFWNEQFFDPARGLIERVCLFPVIGNHEAYERHPRIPFRYFENFSVPTHNSGTEYYYSFDFADAHFCMIDAYATAFTSGTKQHAWIRQDLKQSDRRWKFAVLHYPIYIHRSGPTVSYGHMEVREHLVPLFEKHGVTAVFSGDSHFYQRSEVNGVHYICTGGGGAPLYDPGEAMDYVRASAKTHHYAWLTIEGDALTLEVFDTNNTLIDAMTTGPRQPQLPQQPRLNFERRLPDETWTAGEAMVIESRGADGTLTSDPAYGEEGVLADSTAKSRAGGLTGRGSRFSSNNEADARVRFTPAITERGTYLISVTVPAATSVDAPGTLFELHSPGAEVVRGRISLNAATAGDRWYDIGLFDLAPGATLTFIEVEDQPDRFYADAVRLTRMKPTAKTHNP